MIIKFLFYDKHLEKYISSGHELRLQLSSVSLLARHLSVKYLGQSRTQASRPH